MVRDDYDYLHGFTWIHPSSQPAPMDIIAINEGEKPMLVVPLTFLKRECMFLGSLEVHNPSTISDPWHFLQQFPKQLCFLKIPNSMLHVENSFLHQVPWKAHWKVCWKRKRFLNTFLLNIYKRRRHVLCARNECVHAWWAATPFAPA